MAAGKTDFSDLYAAAYAVKEGSGNLLYDDDAQIELKTRLFPEGRTPRTHNHLAFEALCLVPLALLPYRVALLIWLLINLILLVVIMGRLQQHFPRLRSSLGVPLILPCLGFYPVGQTIFEGQDSIIILTLYATAYMSLKAKRPVISGLMLALAIFKFHLVLPTIFLLFMYRERKAVLSFLCAASFIVGLSILVVGFSGTVQFGKNLITSNSALSDTANRVQFALNPTAYSNIRGLVYWVAGQHAQDTILLNIVIVLSAVVLMVAGLLYYQVPEDFRFPLAIVVTILVSFHLYYHDVSMLLIPMFVAAEAALSGRVSSKVLSTSFAVLMLSPLYPLSYLYNLASLMSIPIAMIGLCLAFGMKALKKNPTATRAVAST